MRVLLPLKNSNRSNLDNSETSSVNVNVVESNPIAIGDVVVQQNLEVGETLAVPLDIVCNFEQQQQQYNHQPHHHYPEEEEEEGLELNLPPSQRTQAEKTVLLPATFDEKAAEADIVVTNNSTSSLTGYCSFDLERVLSKEKKFFSTAAISQQRVRSRKRHSVPVSYFASSLPTSSLSNFESPSVSEVVGERIPLHCINSPKNIKRPRPDSKPAAKTLSLRGNSERETKVPLASKRMAGGGRRRYESDDDEIDDIDQPWDNNCRSDKRGHTPGQLLLTPAENEPPSLFNHPTIIRNFATSSPVAEDAPEFVNDSAPDSLLQTRFNQAIKKLGLEIVEQDGDGNCLFRAVSLQVYGHADHHSEVRERCMEFMARNEEHYSNFVAADSDETSGAGESFADYIARKRLLGVHGNHAEIQAISELFNRPVEVFTPDGLTKGDGSTKNDLKLQPMNIFHAEYKKSEYPIRLSYHDRNHYNAIIDPLVPTAGLGLGLPGLQPGLADKMQVAAAVTESDEIADQLELDRVLKESALEQHVRSTEDEDDDLQRALKESSYSIDFVRLKSLFFVLCDMITSISKPYRRVSFVDV
jgi:OTU-like cysteine protease